jgi:hypothetical protein
MPSKVKSASGRRAKGAVGEREAAAAITQHCPTLRAERNARNGKATSDVLVWDESRPGRQHLIEVKRQESLRLGTANMDKIRKQAEKDGVLGILWRHNHSPWLMEIKWGPLGWVTVSGTDVWRVLELLVGEREESRLSTSGIAFEG